MMMSCVMTLNAMKFLLGSGETQFLLSKNRNSSEGMSQPRRSALAHASKAAAVSAAESKKSLLTPHRTDVPRPFEQDEANRKIPKSIKAIVESAIPSRTFHRWIIRV